MWFNKDSEGSQTGQVIIDEQVVSLSDLKRSASKANVRFWSLTLGVTMISSMVLPYMSIAATIPSGSSEAFSGEVAPGYSMGGVQVTAYGVDLNSWGYIKKDRVVGSNYGIWSGSRLDGASGAISGNSSVELLDTTQSANYNLGSGDKAQGWQIITGRSSYSTDNPDGVNTSSQSTHTDTVSPYRTVSDYNFWDSCMPTSNGNASADVTVSLFADFIIVGVENGQATVLSSPDEISSSSNSDDNTVSSITTNNSSNTARAYYVPLSALFDAYGGEGDIDLTSSEDATITNLLAVMARTDADGTKLAQIAESNDLLDGTSYSSLNSDKVSEDSTAFNPYPYTMVFSKATDNGTVVSSLYNNSEAYVYFSPSSAYTQYMQLRTEFEEISAASTTEINNHDSVKTVQLGYYLAEMAILEAYLDEALPQDMTRGYVGPSEPTSVADTASSAGSDKVAGNGNPKTSFSSSSSASDFRSISYSTIMYDVVKDLGSGVDGSEYRLGQTNAIIDTLSVFGYATDTVPGTGIMKGLDKTTLLNRFNLFTPYDASASTNSQAQEVGSQEDEGSKAISAATNWSAAEMSDSTAAGMYIPAYYPIQQHKMPDSEKVYRFQIIATVPYNVLIALIKENGFAGGVNLSYSSNATNNFSIEGFTSLTDAESSSAAALAAYYSAQETAGEDLGLTLSKVMGNDEAKDMLTVIGGQTQYSSSDLTYTSDSDDNTKTKVTAARIDSALLGYESSSMTADNVHDLFDVVRCTIGLKKESFARFYNPLKSEGGDTDLFVTRVSPALTTYLPAILVNGYTPAGGNEIQPALTTVNCSFDYYSTPSFAPCFASHTSDDCYYGVLNYEQRAFYSSGFIKTLSENAGIPAVEEYQSTQEQIDKLNDEAAAENKIQWQNIGTLYIMAKRYAVITAVVDAVNGNGIISTSSYNEQAKNFENVEDCSSDDNTVTIKSPSGLQFADACVIKANADDTSVEDADNITSSDVIESIEPDTAKKGVAFAAYYDKYFNELLGKSGDYYWVDYTNIKKHFGENGESKLSVNTDGGGTVWPGELNKYTVGFHGTDDLLVAAANYVGIDDSLSINKQETLQSYQDAIKEAASEITTSVLNMVKDMQVLSAANPSQMQNCLAWADYQNASDSENQYESDPTEANVTVNISDDSETVDTDQLEEEGVTSANDLSKYDVKLDTSTADETSIGSLQLTSTDDGGDLQSKMTRGVEGSTWTSTTQPAEYTMSATVARADSMASETGTTYPYSGLVSGRLQSGTDQYAVMQSHVIDYTSISSGIAGDLATRQRAKVVAITNPEYSSITDFLDVIGNLGALFGELGQSMLDAASGAFTNMFFTTSGTGDTNSATAKDETTANQTADAATMVYTSAGGITMNRLPASASTFNPDTGQLQTSASYAAVASSSASPAANAAGVGAVRSFGFLMLTGGSGLYSLLQTFGLTLVMVFIGFIAFHNFYAYSIANNKQMVLAQMQLKVVLPRSILAIFMIGLPPMGASMGFEGGNYILLSLITNVMNFIASIFFNLSGSSIMSVFDIGLTSQFGLDIFAYLGFFLACVILSLCFLVGCVCLILQTFLLFGFYLVGPIAWAFYVWPYGTTSSENSDANNAPGQGFLTDLTNKFNFGLFTAHRAGNVAPVGLLWNYTVIAGLTVAWGLIFWFISMIFLSASGLAVDTDSVSATAAELSTGFPQATAALFGSETTDASSLFGSSSDASGIRILLATVIAVIAFLLMFKMLMDATNQALQVSKTAVGRIAGAIKDGVKDPQKLAAVAGKAANAIGAVGNRLSPNSKIGQAARAVGAAAGAMGLNGRDGQGLAARPQSLRSRQRQDRNALRERMQSEGRSEGEIKQALNAQKQKDRDERRAARPSLADRIGNGLNELSTEEGAQRAIDKLHALKNAEELVKHGHPLSAVGQAFNAHQVNDRQRRQGELQAAHSITDNALDALRDLRGRGVTRIDPSSMDTNVLNRLREAGAITEDADGGLYLAGADAIREIAGRLENESNALGRELAWQRTAEGISRDMSGRLNDGEDLANSLLSLHTADYHDQALGEATMRNMLKDRNLEDNAANRNALAGRMAADEGTRGFDALANGYGSVRNNADGQRELVARSTQDVLDRAQNIQSEEERMSFIKTQFGEACDQDSYIDLQQRLAGGEALSRQELAEMASFDAQSRLSEGYEIPEPLLRRKTVAQSRYDYLSMNTETYLNAASTEDVLALGAAEAVTVQFSGAANTSAANVQRVHDATVASLVAHGLAPELAQEATGALYAGAGNLNAMNSNISEHASDLAGALAEARFQQEMADQDIAASHKADVDGMKRVYNERLATLRGAGQENSAQYASLLAQREAAVQAIDQQYAEMETEIRTRANDSATQDLSSLVDGKSAVLQAYNGAAKVAAAQSLDDRQSQYHAYLAAVGGTVEAGQAYRQSLTRSMPFEQATVFNIACPENATATDILAAVSDIQNGHISAALQQAMDAAGVTQNALMSSLATARAQYEALGDNPELRRAGHVQVTDGQRQQFRDGSFFADDTSRLATLIGDETLTMFADPNAPLDDEVMLEGCLSSNRGISVDSQAKAQMLAALLYAREHDVDNLPDAIKATGGDNAVLTLARQIGLESRMTEARGGLDVDRQLRGTQRVNNANTGGSNNRRNPADQREAARQQSQRQHEDAQARASRVRAQQATRQQTSSGQQRTRTSNGRRNRNQGRGNNR